MTKAQIDISFGLESFFKQGFYALHNADEMVFHINGAAPPNIAFCDSAFKGRIFPVLFGAFGNGNNILM